MTDWHYVVCGVDGTLIGEITSARSRSVTWDLYNPCTAKFDMDGRNPEAGLPQELVTDLLIYRGSQLVFRGRLGSSDDTIDADKHTVQWSAVDYRGLLHRRQIYGQQTYTARDLADIGWDLIDHTQHRVIVPGGELRITRGDNGRNGVGTVRDHVFKDGMWIDQAIDELSNVWGGYQWTIDERLQFQAWSRRGTDRSDFAISLLPAGGNVTNVKRTVDTSQYANTVNATGAAGLNVAYRFAPDVASRLEGRFEWQESATNRTTQAEVDGAAEAALAWHGAIVPVFTFTLAPEQWSPGNPGLGDVIPIQVRSGRLNVDTFDKVYTVTVTVSDDGHEQATVTTGQYRRDLLTFYKSAPSRLDRLERQ